MENLQIRNLLFIFVCIVLRYYLSYVAMTAEEEKLYVMGILFAIIGITMIGLFATGSRKTGPEVFGDKIWWNKYRPVHGALYLWFAYLATHNQPYAWQVLAFDTTFGLYLFLANRTLL